MEEISQSACALLFYNYQNLLWGRLSRAWECEMKGVLAWISAWLSSKSIRQSPPSWLTARISVFICQGSEQYQWILLVSVLHFLSQGKSSLIYSAPRSVHLLREDIGRALPCFCSKRIEAPVSRCELAFNLIAQGENFQIMKVGKRLYRYHRKTGGGRGCLHPVDLWQVSEGAKSSPQSKGWAGGLVEFPER